jgi:hypothetical protein
MIFQVLDGVMWLVLAQSKEYIIMVLPGRWLFAEEKLIAILEPANGIVKIGSELTGGTAIIIIPAEQKLKIPPPGLGKIIEHRGSGFLKTFKNRIFIMAFILQ